MPSPESNASLFVSRRGREAPIQQVGSLQLLKEMLPNLSTPHKVQGCFTIV